MAVNWIEVIEGADKSVYNSQERDFLKELLCYLQQFPISPLFQERLDERDFRTRGDMEKKVNAGMRNYMELKDDVKWVEMFTDSQGISEGMSGREQLIKKEMRRKLDGEEAARKKLNKRTWWSEDYLNRAMTNLYPDPKDNVKRDELRLVFQNTYSIGLDDEMPSGFYLIEIYDNSERPSIPKKIMLMYYDKTTQERVFAFIEDGNYSRFTYNIKYIQSVAFNFASYRSRGNPELWTMTYWGKGCKDIDLGIFNWDW